MSISLRIGKVARHMVCLLLLLQMADVLALNALVLLERPLLVRLATRPGELLVHGLQIL